ncbi:MAG: phosphate ABC transporter permease subunit PstC [Anaerolineaceae bacterium]
MFLYKAGDLFSETPKQRHTFDRAVRNFLLGTALSSVLIVIFILFFTFQESELAISEIGLQELLTGTIWRPGSIIGNSEAQFGLVPMVIGSIYSTIGAIVIGIPLAFGTAILLAEIAPDFIRNIFRTAIELLSGIPSVVYGLFGMVVIAPLIRQIPVEGNTTGFGILNASIILSIMILPTITNITEDAIRAVPDSYREASYALGATHWQTIKDVVLPAANSGIIAAVILGISRALGETMALIMVIGNSIAIPTPVNDNPLSIIFSTARTLTGNIAVEINYAAGAHRSALFFTGVLLFLFLLLINRLANRFMRGRKNA